MIPLGGKALLVLAGVTLVAAISYGVATNDGSATMALGSVAFGAVGLAVAVVLAGPDEEPWVAPGASLTQEPPVGARPALPSPWPVAGGVALGVLALAAATDAVIVLSAVVAVALVGLGWLFQSWSEHPSYTARYGQRLKERLLVPVGLPVAVFCLVGVVAISLSRVFLALPEQGTRAVALAIAVVILLGAFVVAASERMARTALGLLCVLALGSVVAAGVAGLAHGERTFEAKPVVPVVHAALPPGINPDLAARTKPTVTGSGAGASTTEAPADTTGGATTVPPGGTR